jgi:hypothetical protein
MLASVCLALMAGCTVVEEPTDDRVFGIREVGGCMKEEGLRALAREVPGSPPTLRVFDRSVLIVEMAFASSNEEAHDLREAEGGEIRGNVLFDWLAEKTPQREAVIDECLPEKVRR